MNSILNVVTFGAVGDDQTDNSAALQRALDAGAGSGATVFVPPGRYRSGTLFIRSDTTLELAAGATLVGPTEWSGFIPVRNVDASEPWERDRRHFVVIQDAERVTLRGRGMIDGQGWRWSARTAAPACSGPTTTPPAPAPSTPSGAATCRDGGPPPPRRPRCR